jgi:hypothetical protein
MKFTEYFFSLDFLQSSLWNLWQSSYVHINISILKRLLSFILCVKVMKILYITSRYKANNWTNSSAIIIYT